jgi:hypothetical protein
MSCCILIEKTFSESVMQGTKRVLAEKVFDDTSNPTKRSRRHSDAEGAAFPTSISVTGWVYFFLTWLVHSSPYVE